MQWSAFWTTEGCTRGSPTVIAGMLGGVLGAVVEALADQDELDPATSSTGSCRTTCREWCGREAELPKRGSLLRRRYAMREAIATSAEPSLCPPLACVPAPARPRNVRRYARGEVWRRAANCARMVTTES
jgi:hypothetical protein